jgi:tetratricopeptide (TPR) repeat protein
MIVDPGYIERVCSSDSQSQVRRKAGWAWDEYSLFKHLMNETRMPGLALLRAGTEVPREMFVAGSDAGNVLDVREPEQLRTVLDARFRQVAEAPDAETARIAAVLLDEVAGELRRGNHERACEVAREAASRIPSLPDGWKALAIASLLASRAEEAYRAAQRALAIDDGLILLHYLAATAAAVRGDFAEAIQTATGVLAAAPRSWRAHLALARAFAESGQPFYARVHRDLALAEQPVVQQAISIVRGKKDLARARQIFAQRFVMRIAEVRMEPEGPMLYTTYLEPGPELPERSMAVALDLALVVAAAGSDALARLDAMP